MKSELTLREEYRITLTEKTVREIFQDIVDQTRSEMNTMRKYQKDVLKQGGVTKSHIVVREGGHHIHVKLKAERGMRESDYLIETEVCCAENNINDNLVKSVFSRVDLIVDSIANMNS